MEEDKIKEASGMAREMIDQAEEIARGLVTESEEKAEKHHKERLDKMQETIIETINKTVNGKIMGLRSEVQEYIKQDMLWKEEDKKWKDRVNPVAKLYEDTTVFGRVFGKGFIGLLKFIILVGAAIGGLTVIINFFLK